MSLYSIRNASESDASELARLSEQLGYPSTSDTIRNRLVRILASEDDAVFVADSKNGELLGWIHGHLTQYLESEFRVEIAGLIVDERFHRKGIGRALVRHLEAWAQKHGVTQTSVRCRETRAEAHLFYENLGFTRAKIQIVFRKPIRG